MFYTVPVLYPMHTQKKSCHLVCNKTQPQENLLNTIVLLLSMNRLRTECSRKEPLGKQLRQQDCLMKNPTKTCFSAAEQQTILTTAFHIKQDQACVVKEVASSSFNVYSFVLSPPVSSHGTMCGPFPCDINHRALRQ